MRVLQMIDSLKWGGAQKMQVFLAESLIPMGIEVSVVGLKGSMGSDVPMQLQQLGVDVKIFNFQRLLSPVSFLKLVRYVQSGRFDVIHAHLSNANILGVIAGKLANVPSIASLRSSGLDKRYQHALRVNLENFVVREGAAGIMGNGWEVANFASQRFAPREVAVIPNAIDVIPICRGDECRITRIEMVGDTDRTIFLSVGRLTNIKGFTYLIDAFAELHQTHPEAALAIAGSGELHDQLQEKIKSLNLTGHVFLLGLRNDVQRLLAACDFYINSSIIEGLPVSVLEAMAAGLPVIATKVGDTPHVITPDTGILVDPYQPAQLAAAMRDLLENPEKAELLGRNACERIARDFSRSNWNHKLLQLYAQVTPAAVPYLEALENGKQA